MGRTRRWSRLVGLIGTVSAFLLSLMPLPLQPPAQAAPWQTPTIYFPQTGHHLSGDFLQAWLSHGGLMIFGYPISEPMTQDGMTVQYFERARFEYHPENRGTPYVVLATLLGNWATANRKNEDPFKPLPPQAADWFKNDPDRTFFPATGHTIAYGFRRYWLLHGGLYTFGYPISEEFSERNPDTGQVYTVQYFERARFEYHPENRGTEYEVLLGRLGAQYAASQGINTAPVPQASGSITAYPGLLDPRWSRAVSNDDGTLFGAVVADELLIRSAPQTSAPVVGSTYKRYPVPIRGIVTGDSVNGLNVWYDLGGGRYVAAAWVEPLTPPEPPQFFDGHWVDVSLTAFYAIAYDGYRPVYAAIITAGKDQATPTGIFHILYRVQNETMDSATIGIPPGSPGYYHLENVLYTQYFKPGGYAIHGNYWTPPSQFGGFSSHGCVGLMNSDAEWFWNFLNIGSTVSIHY